MGAAMSSNVTRRNFVRLATDMLLSMPVVAGGVLAVSPSVALAAGEDEDYESESDGGSFSSKDRTEVKLVALKPSEMGFTVVDMGSKDNKPVPGAKVRITSRYNKQVVEGVANEEGILTLDIEKLAKKVTDPDARTLYQCNASIEVAAPGYRDFESGIMSVEGSRGHYIPTRSLADGKPYPSMVSFGDWDVLYQENVFTMSPKNTRKHALRVRIKNIKGDGQVKVALVERDSKTVLCEGAAVAKDGVAEVTIERTFLKKGSSEALPLNKTFSIHFEAAGDKYDFPIALTLEEGIFDEPGEAEDRTASPLGTKASGFEVSWPTNAPLGGKGTDKFSSWLPEFPINVYYDPRGAIQLMIKTPSWGYNGDSGDPENSKWGSFPRKSVDDQIKKKIGEMDKLIDKTGAASHRDGKFREIDFSAKLKMTANLQLMGILQWDLEKGRFSGNAAGQAVLALDTSITEQFFAGPVPLFIQFACKLSSILALSVGTILEPPPGTGTDKPRLTELVTTPKNYRWDFTNTGLTFTIIIAPSLSLGLGVKGVASVSLRGSCTITFFIGMTHRGDLDTKTHPLPHLILGYAWSAEVILEFFLFSKTWTLGVIKDPDWYNNWKGGESKGLSSQAEELTAMAPTSMAEFIEGMEPVTDDMLRSTMEFKKSADGSLVAQAEDVSDEVPVGPIMVEEYLDDGTFLEDGTPVGCYVYRYEMPGSQAQAEGAQAQAEPAQSEGAQAQVEPAKGEDQASAQAFEAEALAPEATATDAALAAEAADAATAADAVVAQNESLQAMGEEALAAKPAPAAEPAPAAAGAASSLSAQGEDAKVGDGQTAPEPASFGFAMPEYEPLFDEVEFLSALAEEDMGVSGIGKKGGVRPSSDTLLLKRAEGQQRTYGGPRPQVVQITDTESVLLRIGTVEVAGNPRTRLIATVVESKLRAPGTSQVLDFPIPEYSQMYRDESMKGLKRDDLYDYEFEAAAVHAKWKGGEADRMSVAFVSGRRQFQESQSNVRKLASAATDLVISHVIFEFNSSADDMIFKKDKIEPMSLSGKVILNRNGGTNSYHCISNMQVQRCYEYRDLSTHAIAFLDRSGSIPEQALSDDATVQLGVVFVDVAVNVEKLAGSSNLYVPDQEMIRQQTQQMGTLDSSAYELELWPFVGNCATLMARGGNKVDYYVMRVSPKVESNTSHSPAWGFSRVSVPSITASAEDTTVDPLLRLNAWKEVPAGNGANKQQFLTSRDGKLVSAQIDNPLAKSPTLTFADVGPSNFSLPTFGVLGDFVYWPELRDGSDGYRIDENGEPYEKTGVKESRIMAARLRDGKFSDPFVVADLDHYVDTIVSVSGTKAALAIVSGEMVDKERNAGLIWRTAIPFVRTVTAIGAEAPNAFVSPGYNTKFHITLRNDGNTFLTGCEITMYEDGVPVKDEKGNPIVVTLKFSKDTLLESTHNPSDGSGGLKNTESDYALAPGKISVYQFEYPIPRSWEVNAQNTNRNHKVTFISSGKPELAAQAEGDYIVDYVVEPDEVPMDLVSVEAYSADNVFMNDAPVTVASEGAGSAQGGSTGNEQGGSTGNAQGGRSTTLPRTGDLGGSALAGGVALAGAALAAYGRRRAEVEREAAPDEEGDRD